MSYPFKNLKEEKKHILAMEYYKKLFPILKKYEEEREQLKYKFIVLFNLILCICIVIYFFFGFNNGHDREVIVIYMIVTIISVSLILLIKYILKDYAKNYKEDVIRPIITEFNTSLEYYPELYIDENTIKKSLLFPKDAYFKASDLVQGTMNNTNINFCYLTAYTKDSEDKELDIFNGLFIVIDFNKNFKGQTIVCTDIAENITGNLLGSWIQSTIRRFGELVKLDNIDFEKKFVVYSTDQIEARFLLSHSLMKKLVDFKNKLGFYNFLELSFINNQLIIVVSQDKELFSTPIISTFLDYNNIIEYIDNLNLVKDLLEELDLDYSIYKTK